MKHIVPDYIEQSNKNNMPIITETMDMLERNFTLKRGNYCTKLNEKYTAPGNTV